MRKFKVIKEWPMGMLIGDILKEPGNKLTYNWVLNNPEKAKEYFEEIKEPLFTTEDGFPIYKGDEFWYIRESDWTLVKVSGIVSACDIVSKSVFGSLGNAENYLKDNKPSISRKELRELIHSWRNNNMGWAGNLSDLLTTRFNL